MIYQTSHKPPYLDGPAPGRGPNHTARSRPARWPDDRAPVRPGSDPRATGPNAHLPRRHGTDARSGTARGTPRFEDDLRSTGTAPAGSGTRGATAPAIRSGCGRPTARPIAESRRCSVRPCHCAAACPARSMPGSRPTRAAITPGRAVVRSSGPRDGRCRCGSHQAVPDGQNRGETAPGRRRARWLATAVGGESSLASSAPENSSVTVIPLTSSPVASRASSTASTCQTSWGARARTKDVFGRCGRRGRLTPARWKARWSTRGEGIWADAKSRSNSRRIRPAPQVGWSCLSWQAASRIGSGVLGVDCPQAWYRRASPPPRRGRRRRARGRGRCPVRVAVRRRSEATVGRGDGGGRCPGVSHSEGHGA